MLSQAENNSWWNLLEILQYTADLHENYLLKNLPKVVEASLILLSDSLQIKMLDNAVKCCGTA